MIQKSNLNGERVGKSIKSKTRMGLKVESQKNTYLHHACRQTKENIRTPPYPPLTGEGETQPTQITRKLGNPPTN